MHLPDLTLISVKPHECLRSPNGRVLACGGCGQAMSALPPKADIGGQVINVCVVPIADMSSETSHLKGITKRIPLTAHFFLGIRYVS